METITAITIRQDLIQKTAKSMKTVTTKFNETRVQELIAEIDEIRRSYNEDLQHLRCGYGAIFEEKLRDLNKLLNS